MTSTPDPHSIPLSSHEDPSIPPPAIGLILNPNSRRCKQQLEKIMALTRRSTVIRCQLTTHPDEITPALAKLAGSHIDILAICGGDGTVSRVLTHLMEEKPFQPMPRIAILPGGTANMTAGDTGFRGNVLSALQRLESWAAHRSGHPEWLQRAVLRVKPGPGREPHYGMFFGAGAIVQGIEYTNENIHSRGLKHELSLGMGLLRSIWGIVRQDPRFIQPVPIAIGVDGMQPGPAEKTVLLLISSLNRLFLNIHPWWGEAEGKALHHTLIRYPAGRLLRNLPSLLRGKPNADARSNPAYLSYPGESSTLVFDGPFTLDGEILHACSGEGPVEVSNGGELTFLRIDP